MFYIQKSEILHGEWCFFGCKGVVIRIIRPKLRYFGCEKGIRYPIHPKQELVNTA